VGYRQGPGKGARALPPRCRLQLRKSADLGSAADAHACGQGPLPVSAWRLSVCVLAQHSLRARHSLQHPTTVHDEGVERVSMRLQGAALHQVLCA